MNYTLTASSNVGTHPVDVSVVPALTARNRLTSAFRVLFALPHLILVGGPIVLGLSFVDQDGIDWAAGGGLLGAAAIAVSVIAWFWIVFTGRMPAGLWNFNAFYLRWRVRAAAYVALLRDEYPPFGDGFYLAEAALPEAPADRNRVSVAFRLFLAVPHLILVWCLGVVWMFTSMVAWFAILLTGTHPKGLYEFAVGVLRWSTNVEAYLLLLHDEYPPFALHA
jgi:hypothetical protein